MSLLQQDPFLGGELPPEFLGLQIDLAEFPLTERIVLSSFKSSGLLFLADGKIDRLHSTAHSHHRIIVVGMMGHNAGWLALGAG